MQNKSGFTLIFFLLLFISIQGLQAQQSNTMYFMKNVPQKSQMNPSFQPECNFYLGLAGLSPLQLQAQNSTFGLSNLLEYNSELDQLITPFHKLAAINTPEKFFKTLQDLNYIETELSISLFSLGFRNTKSGTYFSFDVKQRAQAMAVYPKDLISFPYYGPGEGMTYDFSGLALDASVFSELSMGISQKLGDRLDVGWRGKILFGQTDLRTKNFDMTLSTSSDVWQIHSDLLINASVPFLDIAHDSDGKVDLENTDVKSDTDLMNEKVRLILNPENFGLAMDLGVNFRATDWLEVSTSIVDFGAIKWKSNSLNLQNSADYDFLGVELNIEDEDFTETFLDSLDQTFNNFEITEDAYRTWLTTKLYAGAAFYVHPKISFGILSRTAFYPKNIREQVTVSANFRPIRMLSASFSYSIMNNSYKNIGIGLGLRARPFNLYIISDTAPSSALWPYEARDINLRIGMNLVFGCPKKKPVFDLPMVD